jgi:hypothetical protein
MTHRFGLPRRAHWRAAEFLLFMMVIGPLIGPYFSRVENPAFQAVSQVIFDIGRFICPQPAYAFQYGGMPFAVCFRCTAALLGLIVARWLHRPGGALRDWSLLARLAFLACTVLWLVIDLDYTHRGLWTVNIPLMVTHGLIYGISVGGMAFSGLVFLDKWLERPRALVALRSST